MRLIKKHCGMRTADGGSMRKKIRDPRSGIRDPSGFTYVALLAAIVIIGISMGAAGKYWSFVMHRELEEELLFRGEQYRLAIERYYVANCGKTNMPCQASVLPQSIDDLLSDGRFPQAKRHLRRKYQDPITRKDFEVIRDLTKGNRISGVFSPSDKEPIKKTGFPEQYQAFENKKSYKEWTFVYTMTPAPGQPGAPVRVPPVRPPTP
jgi:type II secretory pathway pseudopilin PulG